MVAGQVLLQRIVDTFVWPTIVVLYAVGILLFVIGIIEFLWKLKDGKADAQGKQHMIWGIVGIVIMVSVNAIISLILNTFGIDLNAATDASRINSTINTVQFR